MSKFDIQVLGATAAVTGQRYSFGFFGCYGYSLQVLSTFGDGVVMMGRRGKNLIY